MRKRALCGDDDSNDEAVDAENTGHDDGNDGLHNELRPHDTHGGNSNAGLGSAIRGAHACEGGIRKSSCSINTCKPSKLSLGEDQRGPAGQRESARKGGWWGAQLKMRADAAPRKPKRVPTSSPAKLLPARPGCARSARVARATRVPRLAFIVPIFPCCSPLGSALSRLA